MLFCITSASAYSSEPRQNQLRRDAIAETVNQVSKVLTEYYVYPEVAVKMQDFLNQRMLAGAYDGNLTQRELIEALESDLKKVSQDGHIDLLLAEDSIDRTSNVLPKTKPEAAIDAQIITNNGKQIGYLRANTFGGDRETKRRLIAAVGSVLSSDSLIIDLRQNRGGDPNLVAMLSSYFVADQTLLWSIFNREGEQVIAVRSKRNKVKYLGEICILTSAKTYSAAEAFTYTMKHLKRACVVGEITGGGAHLIDVKRVSDEIDMRVPVARAHNHITESNWEGVGVVPTLEVNAYDAKAVAIKLLSGELSQ